MPGPDPATAPPLRLSVWLLSIAVAATMVGMTIAVYRGDGSSINAFLFLDLGFTHQSAARIERVALAAVSFAAVVGVWWPRWFLMVPASVYLLAEAVAGYHVRGYAFSELTPAAHALRYLTPLAAALLACSAAADGARSAAHLSGAWLLRLGLAVVFATHGYEAWQLHPEFIDLLITSSQNYLDVRVEEATASVMLRVIGVVDMLAALLLLIRPWRSLLVWLMFWGLVTAMSRMTSYGWGAHPDVLMRATHFVVPLTLILVTARSRVAPWLRFPLAATSSRGSTSANTAAGSRSHDRVCLMLAVGVVTWSAFRARAAEPAPGKLPMAAPASTGMDGAALEPIDSLVQQAIEAGEMPGAVVVIGHRGAVVFHRAYGHRQTAPSAIPMTEDTLFDMASITKPVVTATCIMLLIEQERIGLEDPVADYLPEFASQGKNTVTVKQLLLHTGGLIPDNPLSDYEGGAGPAVEKLLGIDLNYPPGSRFRYSDVGFVVLGELVKRVTGEDLHAFSREAIFAPLGMTDSGFIPGDTLRVRAAATERRDGRWMIGEVHDPRAHALGGVAGHAGLFSTAADLSVYAQMMIGGGQYGGMRVLAPETIKAMTAAYAVPGGQRGLGWDKRSAYSSNRGESMTDTAFGHGGFTGTVLWIDPQLDLFVIFLSNRLHPDGRGSVNRLAGQIATIAANAAATTSGSGSTTHDPDVSVRRRDDGARD